MLIPGPTAAFVSWVGHLSFLPFSFPLTCSALAYVGTGDWSWVLLGIRHESCLHNLFVSAPSGVGFQWDFHFSPSFFWWPKTPQPFLVRRDYIFLFFSPKFLAQIRFGDELISEWVEKGLETGVETRGGTYTLPMHKDLGSFVNAEAVLQVSLSPPSLSVSLCLY